MRTGWPDDAPTLELLQPDIARAAGEVRPWSPSQVPGVGATFVASDGDALFAAAVVFEGGTRRAAAVAAGTSPHPYVPGLLALREGPVLERAVRALDVVPDVVLVNATGRDHPRGAGLALHLGWVLDLPTIGVTDRPLVATGSTPGLHTGQTSPLRLGDRVVGARLRVRTGVRPLCVHAAWRTDAEVAVTVVRSHVRRARTPRPLREARRLAREARARS